MKLKSIFLTAAMLLILPSVIFSAEDSVIDQIMLADIPFSYGEEAFIERVQKKAQGRQPVGMVLSGGSARAFAHIGVLRRMEELNLVPDFIVANSMGSIVGLLYGAGFSPDQIAEIIQTTDIGELFKLSLPVKGGIIDVGKFSGLLHKYTGDIDLTQLPIPVMVLCEDLLTKRQVKIAEGNLGTVMEAAYALPVYFNPIEYKEHLLIDGGIANLVPLDTAFEYSGTVIASTTFYSNPDLNPRNPITNINIALDVGKSRTGVSQIKELKPLLIRCNVESFSFMEFGSLSEIQSAGWNSADAVSAELLALSGSPVTPELTAIRKEKQQIIDQAVQQYRYLESIPVFAPSLLVTTGLGMYNSLRSERYYNTDLHLLAGIDYSKGYFTSAVSAGAGVDLGSLDGIFPVLDASASWDLSYNLRMDFAYSLRFDPAGFADFTTAAGLFSSSDVYGGIRWVALADEHLSFGLLLSGEVLLDGIAETAKSLITLQTDLSAESDRLSEENYAAAFFTGLQLPNPSGAFGFTDTAYFADLVFSIPFPGSGGLLKWESRGFTRRPLLGSSSNYYLRDGMRTSIAQGEYGNVNFASTDLIFNPYNFRPAFAEVFMLKEVELGAFGEIGFIDGMLWSSGLSLSMDLSLIGLKPLKISGYAGWDSLSGGMIGGVTFTP